MPQIQFRFYNDANPKTILAYSLIVPREGEEVHLDQIGLFTVLKVVHSYKKVTTGGDQMEMYDIVAIDLKPSR